MQSKTVSGVDRLNQKNNPEGSASSIEYIRMAKEHFGEASHYINIPDHQFIIGEHPDTKGYPTVYTVTDKVVGRILDYEISDPNSKLSDGELVEFYQALVNYYKAASTRKGDYLSDLNRHEQFMYGHTAIDPKNRIYLIDLDLILVRGDISDSINSRNTLWNKLEHTRLMVDEAKKARGEVFSPILDQIIELQHAVMPERY